MDKQIKKEYTIPDLSVMVVRVERGYTTSGANTDEGIKALRTGYGDNDGNNNYQWN